MALSHESIALAEQIEKTGKRIDGTIVKTPCIRSRAEGLNDLGLFFKCENFQATGSFKVRGAMSKLSTLSTTTPIITASSGNHGIACAYAAGITGHRISVVLPEHVAKAKLSKIKNLGATVILHPGDSGLAERHARALSEKDGYEYVSPYNDHAVMAGQGTIALELLDQLARVDRIYVSMGGGGLISGIGALLKSRSADTEIVGVSAENSAALAASMTRGEIVDVDHVPTLADGCAGGIDYDSVTFPIATEVVDRVIKCSEIQIAAALHHIAWTEKMLVEGAAALALAGYFADAPKTPDQVNVVLLCGANFDRDTILPILNDAGL